jgi:hypothetical protein
MNTNKLIQTLDGAVSENIRRLARSMGICEIKMGNEEVIEAVRVELEKVPSRFRSPEMINDYVEFWENPYRTNS